MSQKFEGFLRRKARTSRLQPKIVSNDTKKAFLLTNTSDDPVILNLQGKLGLSKNLNSYFELARGNIPFKQEKKRRTRISTRPNLPPAPAPTTGGGENKN